MTVTDSQRRYHVSNRRTRLDSVLSHSCSSMLQLVSASHEARRSVVVPPSTVGSYSPLQRPKARSIRSLCLGKRSFTCDESLQRLRTSQRALGRPGSRSSMSHQISLRCTPRHRYGYLNGSDSRETSTQPIPTAHWGRKASLQALSAPDLRSAWLSLKFRASATSSPSWSTSASGVMRQSVRVLASRPVTASMAGPIRGSMAGGIPNACCFWRMSESSWLPST